eukprot:TRINITY_DN1342_c0_g1_i4.p1 TRINITY_DN1342_c0_g1~~TRINITY_DN1342_c0_g1_i4.p1  ORF type:complete len:292 (+),score=60.12 TRINITY_DN1342_c0_g1_i4:145-1020(+)
MTCKNRTSDFRSLTKNLQQQVIVTVRESTPTHLSYKFPVGKLTGEIARDIAETEDKLLELSKLAKAKASFGDPTEQIDEYTFSIKGEITKIQRKLKNLEELMAQQKSPNHHSTLHISTVVSTLNISLREITKQFGQTLELRTENLKSQQKRKERFIGNRRIASSPSPVFQPAFDMFDDNGGFVNDGDVTIQMTLEPSENDLILNRVDHVKDIQRQINDVYEIFTQLAGMVNQQGEQIRRIEDRMDETLVYGENAHKSLLKALTSMSSDRRLILKLLAILAFFVVVFMLFFA